MSGSLRGTGSRTGRDEGRGQTGGYSAAAVMRSVHLPADQQHNQHNTSTGSRMQSNPPRTLWGTFSACQYILYNFWFVCIALCVCTCCVYIEQMDTEREVKGVE